MKRKRIDLKGQRFGLLVVLGYDHTDKNGNAMWKCKCDCGNETVVIGRSLRIGHTTSCGCLHRKRLTKAVSTHQLSKEKIYQTWSDMKQRCFNQKHASYCNYGGRGITVCDEWKNNFQSFYDHISQLPHFGERGYSLDRINNDGNYEPGNVRWATPKEQTNNRNRRISRKGVNCKWN